MKKLLHSYFLLLVLLLGGLHFPTAGWCEFYTQIYVFGDSLSDTGRLPVGRFTNSYIWPEYLAETLNLIYDPRTDFAVGGATTGTTNVWGNFPGLQTQIDDYLANNPTADPQALYIVWAGANDLLNITDPTQIPQLITSAVTNLVTALTKLRLQGVEHLLVLNLPNLGKTPRGLASGTAEAMTTLSMTFNQALAQALQPLEVIQIDTFALLDALTDPQAALSFAHLTNTTEACVNSQTATDPCSNPSEYFFWDDIHPTNTVHRVLALVLYAAVAEPRYEDFTQNAPVPQGWAFLPLVEIVTDTGRQTLLNTRLFQDPHDIRFQFEVTYSNAFLPGPFQNFVKFPSTAPAHPTFEDGTGQLHIPVISVDDGTVPTNGMNVATQYTADLILVPKTANLPFEPTTFRLTNAVELPLEEN